MRIARLADIAVGRGDEGSGVGRSEYVAVSNEEGDGGISTVFGGGGGGFEREGRDDTS